MNKEIKQNLKEKWENRVHGGHFVDKLYPFSPTSEVADDIEEWWLERISEAIEHGRQEVLKEILLEYEKNRLDGKGFDFYFVLNDKLTPSH